MTIVFDMDGTIANLYAVPNWLEQLRAYSPAPYANAEPMWDMNLLAQILDELRLHGVRIAICSWLSKEPTKAYNKAVREAKKQWLAKYGFPFDDCHIISYGVNKWEYMSKYIPEDEVTYLVDDEAKNRLFWDGKSIDPTQTDIIDWLGDLLNAIA